MGCPLHKDLFLSQNSSLYPNEFVEALFALSSYFRGCVCLGLEGAVQNKLLSIYEMRYLS